MPFISNNIFYGNSVSHKISFVCGPERTTA